MQPRILSVKKGAKEKSSLPEASAASSIMGYLEDFGLTQKEAKIYYILSSLGSATANQISSAAQYNRLQTYRAVKSLLDRGLVEISLERPRRYTPLKIEHAISLLEQEASNRMVQLETTKPLLLQKWAELQDFPISQARYSFRIVQGGNNAQKFGVMLFESAEKEIDFAVKGRHLTRLILEGTDDLLEGMAGKNLAMRGITEFNKNNLQSVRRFLQFSNLRNVPAADLAPIIIIDNKEVLIYLTNGDSNEEIENAIWTNHPELVRTLKGLFNVLWSNSQEGKITLKQIE